jgi:hypothetical protein
LTAAILWMMLRDRSEMDLDSLYYLVNLTPSHFMGRIEKEKKTKIASWVWFLQCPFHFGLWFLNYAIAFWLPGRMNIGASWCLLAVDGDSAGVVYVQCACWVWGPKEPPHHVEKRADKTASIKSRATFSSLNNQKNTKKNPTAQATVVIPSMENVSSQLVVRQIWVNYFYQNNIYVFNFFRVDLIRFGLVNFEGLTCII